MAGGKQGHATCKIPLSRTLYGKDSGHPHVSMLWLGVSKGMLPVKHIVHQGLRTSTCLNVVAGGKQEHATCKIPLYGKDSGHPHVSMLWLGVSKGMLPVKYHCHVHCTVRTQDIHMSQCCGWGEARACYL